MENYSLETFTQERLEFVARQWRREAGDEEFAVELADMFGVAARQLEPTPGKAQSLELRDNSIGQAVAILEIVDSPHRALTKLLKLFICPAFWGIEDDDERVDAVASAYAGAFMHTIHSGAQKGFTDVKIYGRSNEMYSLLKVICSDWDKRIIGFSASMEGRWLKVTKIA